MSDKRDTRTKDKNQLTLSKDLSIAIKKSDLVKRGLELADEPRKRQIEVLIGNCDYASTLAISLLVKSVIKDRYNLNVRSSENSEELLQFAENGAVDIFILILNNIFFHRDPVKRHIDMEKSLQLITQVKNIHKNPVIALSGWFEDFSIITRAKIAADFFFPLPWEPDIFMEAIEKCLALCFTSDERQRKLPSEVLNNTKSCIPSERINLLLPYYLNFDFKVWFEELGYIVYWSDNLSDIEIFIKNEKIDVGLEWQWGEYDYTILNLVKEHEKNIPVILCLNWNRKLPGNFTALGYQDYLTVPFKVEEVRKKIHQVVKKSINNHNNE